MLHRRSKSQLKTGHAYSIHNSIISHRLRNSSSIFTAKLSAIYSCLSQLAQLPPNLKYIILSDSLAFLSSIQDPHHPILSYIRISFIWIPGHIDLPDHDVVDQAAKKPKNHQLPSLQLPTSKITIAPSY